METKEKKMGRLKYIEMRTNILMRPELSTLYRRSNKVSEESKRKVYDFLEAKYKTKERRWVQHQQIRRLLSQFKPSERILLLSDYAYKFSKSNDKYIPYFAENHYKEYASGTIVSVSKKEEPLSFLVERTAVLRSIIYGDQLTRLKLPDAYNDEYAKQMNTDYYNSLFDIYVAQELRVKDNFSMSEPRNLLAVMKAYYDDEKNSYYDMMAEDFAMDGSSVYKAYRQIGFEESATIIKDISKAYQTGKMLGLRKCLAEKIKKYGTSDIF